MTPEVAPVTVALHPEPLGRSVAALTAIRFGSLLAGFATSALAARIIGPQGVGTAATILAAGAIAALLANAGLSQAAIYFVGRNGPSAQRVVSQFIAMGLVSAGSAGLVNGIAVLALGNLLGVSSVSVPIAILAASPLLLFEIAGALLLGLRLIRTYSIVQLIESQAALALTAVLLFGPAPSADGFVMAAGIAYLIGGAWAARAIWRHFGAIRFSWEWGFARQSLAFGFRGQLGNIAQFLNLRFDILLVSALLDVRQAGLYVIAVKVSEIVIVVANAAGSLLFPAVAGADKDRAAETTERLTRSTLLVVTLAAGALLLAAEALLQLAFGEDFLGAAQALRITALAMIPLAASRVLAGALKGHGRPGLTSLAAFVGLSFTIAGDLAFIPLWGIDGAAVASLLAYSASAGAMLVAYTKVTGRSPASLIPRPMDVARLWSASFSIARDTADRADDRRA